MARTKRTRDQLVSEILKMAAKYTEARTDWEGPRRAMKKTALRTMSRLVRQLCLMDQHSGQITEGMIDGKCTVCDPSGENKGYKPRKKRAAPKDAKRLAHKMQAPPDALTDEEIEEMI